LFCSISSTNHQPLESSWGGYTSTIYRIPDNIQIFCKSFDSFSGKYAQTNFPAEVEAFERFMARDRPQSILKYYGMDKTNPDSIILELA
jgi:hypothetical protein